MKRALFVLGLTLAVGGGFLLGVALYLNRLSDPLLHILAGIIAGGAVIAALVADPKPFLSLMERLLAIRFGKKPAE